MISIVSILEQEESSSMSENLVTEPSSPSVNGHPRILERPAETKNFFVAGGSKEFKEHIKSLGGKWVAKERGYILPASQRDHVSSLVEAAKSSPSETATVEQPNTTPEQAAAPTSSSSAAETAEPMEVTASSSAGGGDVAGGEKVTTGTNQAGVEPGPEVEPQTASEPAHEPEAVAEPASAPLTSAEPVAGTSASTKPYSNLSIVVLNTRSIGVIGEPTPALSNEFNQLGGKFSKTLKIGDDKQAGWSFHKNQLGKLQSLLPDTPLTPAPAPSPIGTRSPTSRKKSTTAAVVGTSSKADTPVFSPENKNKDTGDGDKRKRKRTPKAEESEQQAQHAPTAPTASAQVEA